MKGVQIMTEYAQLISNLEALDLVKIKSSLPEFLDKNKKDSTILISALNELTDLELKDKMFLLVNKLEQWEKVVLQQGHIYTLDFSGDFLTEEDQHHYNHLVYSNENNNTSEWFQRKYFLYRSRKYSLSY